MFLNADLCRSCGGACCKQVPGSTSPEDWGAPDEAAMVTRLGAALASKRWHVDRWYAESWREEKALQNDVLFVRPAVRGREEDGPLDELEEPIAEDSLARFTWMFDEQGHRCTFLGKTGCELTADERPSECLALEPIAPGGSACEPRAGAKQERALEWAPYQALLELAIQQEHS